MTTPLSPDGIDSGVPDEHEDGFDYGALPVLSAHAIATVARTLRITNHKTATRTLWVPNVEQVKCWQAAEQGSTEVLKPRAIGVSTAFDLDDLLWTVTCDSRGHPVRTAIFVDTDDKAKERIAQIRNFMQQPALRLRESGVGADHKIRFPNGAEIVAMSAGGKRPAASLQVQRVRWSERCFYPPSAMASAGMSINLAARQVTETTVSPDGDSFAALRTEWRDKRSIYEGRKLFFRVEDHDEYRADPASITDDEWERMQREGGYADRAAAAWFLTVGLPACGNDESRAWHELPNLERHMWQAGSGRLMRRTPSHSVPVPGLAVEMPGQSGDILRFDVYGRMDGVGPSARLEQIRNSGQVLITVDTARGVGATRSVVLAVDKRDRVILGSACSAWLPYADLAAMAAEAKSLFPGSTIVVEDDGVGDATCQELDRLGVPYVRFRQATVHQDKETGDKTTNAARCLNAARNAVNQGLEEAPAEMCAECDELSRDERGNLTGLKDFCMIYGMALVFTEEHPYDLKHAARTYDPQPNFREDLEAHLQARGIESAGRRRGR